MGLSLNFNLGNIGLENGDSITLPVEDKLEIKEANKDVCVEERPHIELPQTVDKPTVEDILSVIPSGIGLDVAKNHTGICLWREGKVETLGFAIEMEYDNSCSMAEAKMRLEFKEKLRQILAGYDWSVCIIEDVYSGANFDTVRKLLALNCVIDELMLEGSVSVGTLYRRKEAEWMKNLRQILKLGKKLNPKYECELILEYLGAELVLQHKNDTNAEKLGMFYEDRCDALGQLLSLAMYLEMQDKVNVVKPLKLRDIKFVFVQDLADIKKKRDKVFKTIPMVEIKDFDVKHIEKSLISAVSENRDKVLYTKISTSDLGVFGMTHGFEFYGQGYGYLVAYAREIRKAI